VKNYCDQGGLVAKYVYNCLKCGKEQKLRFKPKEEYCSACFREIKLSRMTDEERSKVAQILD
jgi:rRNA maturation endonuclease Nob1